MAGDSVEPADRQSETPKPLGQISTVWSVVLRAKDGAQIPTDEVARFFSRYHGAVYRYFLTATRLTEVAEDLTQDFAVRFLRGDFSNVHPDRGRFRDFLRVSLANQLRDHQRRQRVRAVNEPLQEEPVDHNSQDIASFNDNWREEILAQAWTALEHHQETTGQMFFLVLKLRAVESDRSSANLARIYSEQIQVETSDDAFRKILQRSRRRFGELLLNIIADTLAVPTREELQRELAELKLLPYCDTLLNEQAS
jgi:RNA polymerase sigma-70 factor (ECF subfamily)